jgi:hypothetical protein
MVVINLYIERFIDAPRRRKIDIGFWRHRLDTVTMASRSSA